MKLSTVRDLLDRQAGVVSRRQLVERGGTDADLRRWVRRRELTRVHTGVYVDHTGPLTWSNRAWAAVVFHWPAALTHESAVHRAGDVIHVAVDATRTPTWLPGVESYQLVGLEDRVQWNLSPPRVRVEDALLSMCARAGTGVEALTLVSDACRRRITTQGRASPRPAARRSSTQGAHGGRCGLPRRRL